MCALAYPLLHWQPGLCMGWTAKMPSERFINTSTHPDAKCLDFAVRQLPLCHGGFLLIVSLQMHVTVFYSWLHYARIPCGRFSCCSTVWWEHQETITFFFSAVQQDRLQGGDPLMEQMRSRATWDSLQRYLVSGCEQAEGALALSAGTATSHSSCRRALCGHRIAPWHRTGCAMGFDATRR